MLIRSRQRYPKRTYCSFQRCFTIGRRLETPAFVPVTWAKRGDDRSNLGQGTSVLVKDLRSNTKEEQ